MDESPTPCPTLTVWPIRLYQGVVHGHDGPSGGWGWRCDAHPQPVWYHGYPSDVAAMLDLREHLAECPGRG